MATILNDAQRATLKTAILADGALAPLTTGATTNFNGLKDLLNAPANPATLAWRLSVMPAEIDDAPDYTTFDAISAGKRDSWFAMLAFPRDFTRNKTRKWVTDIWGNATAASNAEAVLQGATESATKAQVIISGATKTTGTVTAIDRNFYGQVVLDDIQKMFG